MTRGVKGFSVKKKRQLRQQLREQCEESWAICGYKRTNIADLTAAVGISTGAFYLLYPAKEDLFCETLQALQKRLKDGLLLIIEKDRSKTGLVKAMEWTFKEYESAPYLYNFGTEDFKLFVEKLPAKMVEQIESDGSEYFYEAVSAAGLTFKVEKGKAHGVINSLMYTVTLKEPLAVTRFEIFQLLLGGVIDYLFE